MTPQIDLVLGILPAAIVMFITERIRVDVVALMVPISLGAALGLNVLAILRADPN
jgi:hypothetical protein